MPLPDQSLLTANANARPMGGLATLGPGGYRGPNPTNVVGRGATDFSAFPQVPGRFPPEMLLNPAGPTPPMGPRGPMGQPMGPMVQGQQPVLPPGIMGAY